MPLGDCSQPPRKTRSCISWKNGRELVLCVLSLPALNWFILLGMDWLYISDLGGAADFVGNCSTVARLCAAAGIFGILLSN